MTTFQKIKQVFLNFKYRRFVFFVSVFFSLLYHVAFLITFRILEVYPMFYFNFFSVTVFLIVTILAPKLKSFVVPYAFCFVEVVAHQILADWYIGGEAAFHFFILIIGLLPILSFSGNFKQQIGYGIGKILVPDAVLKKTGKFTPEEFEQMKLHTTKGVQIINEVIGISEDKDFVKMAIDVASNHHERWDGEGYPFKVKGEDIPVSGRIMAIADVYDALVSERCYKRAMPVEQAFEIIRNDAGSHFDPLLVKVFLDAKDEVLTIQQSLLSTHV